MGLGLGGIMLGFLDFFDNRLHKLHRVEWDLNRQLLISNKCAIRDHVTFQDFFTELISMKWISV